MKPSVALGAFLALSVPGTATRTEAQGPAAQRVTPNLETNIERPLRYRPDGADFVIENGREFFNRSLYGGNTAFRVDGGDRPEFVLYLPGRGGNLRLAARTSSGTKWLHDAAQITMRYRPGELLYEIHDPLLGPGASLRVAAVAPREREGLLVRVEGSGLRPGVELIWAYGGVNGERGQRDGDIGTEAVPISEWFQLKPSFAQGNLVRLAESSFTLTAKGEVIAGIVPQGSRLTIAEADQWNDPEALLTATSLTSPQRPIVVGRVAIQNNAPLFLALQREPGASGALASPSAGADLPGLFSETVSQAAALRGHVSIDTPDPYLNAAAGALNVAADAVWDEPQHAIMHGAIAWRQKLLGWRGPYMLDALGWPDRARAHFTYWASRQNNDPVPVALPPPDENANLARSERALHSNGDLSNSHYDMNVVYIDALFRHLRWTGDIAYARTVWPVIERHLAFERRLFRREFGPRKLPLYEAYAAIWASDDLQYSGGGAAHASAYNYWHNKMAAELAPLVGADPAPYAREADLIARGMRELLWQHDRGMFAESKDWLGLQRVHPGAALWTFYTTMDSGLPTSSEALKMTRYVDAEIPHLPVRGPGVPAGLHTLASTNWMPYTWSINNVVMGEAVHAALGFWQAGRADEAWRITKGSLLAAMFMGISPGNVGSMSYLDVYRRESQRDFADGSGVLSRAIIEGLFGVRPDALKGELVIAPGFPSDWDHAALRHPRLDLRYTRSGLIDAFSLTPRFARSMSVRVSVPARAEHADVTVNGRKATWKRIDDEAPRVEIDAPVADRYDIRIEWTGPIAKAAVESPATTDAPSHNAAQVMPPLGTLETIDLTASFNDRVTEIFRAGKYLSPRSPFVSLAMPSQGVGYWAGHVNATADIDDTGLRAAAGSRGVFILGNGLRFATAGPGSEKNIAFASWWDNYPREVTTSLAGKARRVHLLMAGSTNAMQSRLDNGEVVVTYKDGSTSRLALRNPETWWPIEQDYFIDDYQFRVASRWPMRVDLKTGEARTLDPTGFKGQGKMVPGGAATVLELSLDPGKDLSSLTVRALANDVVIGLMAATLDR